jgi:hypothetical protein
MSVDTNDFIAFRTSPASDGSDAALGPAAFHALAWNAEAQNGGSGQGGGQAQCRFLDHWVQMESRGDHMAANGQSTAIGRWQMTQAAFADVGLVRQVSAVTENHYGGREWSNVEFLDNPFGIRNLEDLRANPAAQDYYGRLYHQAQWREAQRQGLVRDFIGQTVDVNGRRVAINESALLTCMGYLGAGDCGRMLRGQPMTNPGYTAHALWRMSVASACDGSDVAGQNTPVDAEANIAATADAQYCDPKVLERLEQTATVQVNAITVLAGHPQVGYRTAEGASPLQAQGVDLAQLLTNGGFTGQGIGLSGGASSVPSVGFSNGGFDLTNGGFTGTGPRITVPYGGFSTGGFRTLSCLDTLLGGINIIFAPPSLPNILGILESYVCRQIEQLYARAVAPLNQSFFRDFGVGGISVPFGVGVSTGGPPGVRINSGNVMTWSRNPIMFNMFGSAPMLQNAIPERRGIFAR